MTVYVLFEVEIAVGRQDDYLARAASLKESLAQAEGFVRSERFESLVAPGKLLSLSVWESEEAVTAWRNVELHRACQEAGRAGIFEDYSITVLSPVQRAYGMVERAHAPEDSRARLGDGLAAHAFGPEHHALLYAYLARAAKRVSAAADGTSGDGTAPDAFLASATKAYARSRAQRMRARALADGMPLDAKTYQSYSEVPGPLEGSVKTMTDAPEGATIITSACPWHAAWKAHGVLEYGAAFCASFDAELARAFGPDVDMRVPCTLTQGADSCSFVFEGAHFDEQDDRDIAARNDQLAGSATKPFDFHAAHLLHVFGSELSRAYGEAAQREAVGEALGAFADEFGEHDRAHLVSLEQATSWE